MKIKRTKVSGLGLNLMHDCPDIDTDRRTEEGYLPPVCLPCWNRTLNKRYHKDYIPTDPDKVFVDTNISELIDQLDSGSLPKPYPENTCQFYSVGQHNIILASKTEFFHKSAGSLPFRITSMLGDIYPDVASRCRILTKQNITANLRHIPKTMLLGASITTLSKRVSKVIQPAASSPRDLISMLKKANKKGYKTWVVVEPQYIEMDLRTLIEAVPFISEIWVGRLNGGREIQLGDSDATVGTLARTDDEILEDLCDLIHWVKEKEIPVKIRPKKEILRKMVTEEIAKTI